MRARFLGSDGVFCFASICFCFVRSDIQIKHDYLTSYFKVNTVKNRFLEFNNGIELF